MTDDSRDSLGLEISQVVLLSLRSSITSLACNAEDSVCRGTMSGEPIWEETKVVVG